MLDIETLGRVPGCAVIEIGAIAFNGETGTHGETFHRFIEPMAPYTADVDTLEWHRRKGTYPFPKNFQGYTIRPVHSPGSAVADFADWCESLGDVEAWWSWGAAFDFPILSHLLTAEFHGPPWKYWQCRCARTVWATAFGDRRRPDRTHDALEDCRSAIRDLFEALDHLIA